MKTYDFIKQAVGSKVYLTPDRDLAMDYKLRYFIFNKTELNLIGLDKSGMAIVEHNGQRYKVRPSNVREVGS